MNNTSSGHESQNGGEVARHPLLAAIHLGDEWSANGLFVALANVILYFANAGF